MSTFSGLNTALTALRAQRTGLEVAGQNIANVNTEGYTRQRAELTSLGGAAGAARYATGGAALGGVHVAQLSRLRDNYLDARAYTEHERQASLTRHHQVVTDVQRVFTEPSDTGLQAKLDELWAGFADVADNPAEPAARTQLLARAAIVANTLGGAVAQLADQYAAHRTQLDGSVAEVNSTAARLAALNDTVARATAAGASVNELNDQRDVLAMRLVELTGATVSRGADSSVNLTLNGAALVAGTTAHTLAAAGGPSLAGQAGDPARLVWADSGAAAGVPGGQIGAELTGLGTTLPQYAGKLDEVAAALAGTVNALHTTGYTAAGTPGGAFFSGTTAATIAVAISDPAEVAVSAGAGLALDGGVGDQLASLGGAAGGADQVYRSAVSSIGILVQSTEQLAVNQNTITDQVDLARLSASAVNVDEELTSMLSYQRAYEAAARVMNAVDSMLDTLINRTGS
jgi:flagellar hook-associated protein 1